MKILSKLTAFNLLIAMLTLGLPAPVLAALDEDPTLLEGFQPAEPPPQQQTQAPSEPQVVIATQPSLESQAANTTLPAVAPAPTNEGYLGWAYNNPFRAAAVITLIAASVAVATVGLLRLSKNLRGTATQVRRAVQQVAPQISPERVTPDGFMVKPRRGGKGYYVVKSPPPKQP